MQSLTHMLLDFSKGRHWPSGDNKPGSAATDFVQKVKLCIGLMTHAPVISRVDDKWQIVPLQPIPEDKEWKNMIGFDPIQQFGQVLVEEAYFMKVWARDNSSLPVIQFPKDPNDSSRRLPHGAYVDFDRTPMCVVPHSILLQWLFYHGIPMNKGSEKQDLLQQVQHAIDIKQPLDEDKISSVDATNARSYVSIDSISLLSTVTWKTDGAELLSLLRGNETPSIDANYINEIFGEGMNGIRERAWLRLTSGHMNLETLCFARSRATIDGGDRNINMFEIKVTPSMKNLVYSVYVVFTSGGVYVPKLSKCDCPNGWLFCSHTLSVFLLIYLIQIKNDWDLREIIKFMPVPIKTLQSIPFAASHVFEDLADSRPGAKQGSIQKDSENNAGSDEDVLSKIAKKIAKDIPGYTESTGIDNEDASKENELFDEGLHSRRHATDVKSLDLCCRLNGMIKGYTEESGSNALTGKVTSSTLKEYNQKLVDNEENNKDILVKNLQHERLYKMTKENKISRDRTLWNYLDHYAEERSAKIQQLSPIVRTGHRLEGVTDSNCANEFLTNISVKINLKYQEHSVET